MRICLRLALIIIIILSYDCSFSQDIMLFAKLISRDSIQVSFRNEDSVQYNLLLEQDYIGIYEEEGKLSFEILDSAGNLAQIYKSNWGFPSYIYEGTGSKAHKEYLRKDSVRLSNAKFLNKLDWISLFSLKSYEILLSFNPIFYERLPEEAFNDVWKYILIKNSRYKARILYTPVESISEGNVRILRKKLVSNWFEFTHY